MLNKKIRKDLTGKTFGRLTVVELDEEETNSRDRAYWKCKCECGNEVSVSTSSLLNGNTKSCGCIQREKVTEKNTKHLLHDTRLYSIWCNVKRRCNNNSDPAYKNYGKRNIMVCDDWANDFTNFYNWAISNGYEENLTIDRIDVNGNYEPSNCRWVNYVIQANNKRDNIYLIIDGNKKTITEWYRIYNPNISIRGMHKRYKREGFICVEQLFRDKAS